MVTVLGFMGLVMVAMAHELPEKNEFTILDRAIAQ
jgi:hypothetical protein